MSSTAPAYSMAATLGLVVAIVGVHSPGTLVVSFLPMLCIAFAFRELNRADPDCGITFTWAARAFGPRTGWMGGWGIIAADVIVMASLSQIAGRYVFLLFGGGREHVAGDRGGRRVHRPAHLGVLPGHRGLCPAAAGAAGDRGGRPDRLRGNCPGQGRNWPCASRACPSVADLAESVDWFLLQPVGLVPAGCLHLLGWDCALSVNEETRDSARTPGRAAVIATVLLVAIFAAVSTTALAYAGPAFLADHSNRRTLRTSVRDLVTKGILPLLGGLVLLGAFVLSIKSYWPASSSASSFHGVGGIFLIGAGSLVLGVIIMLITSRFLPRFFSRAGGSR